MMSLREEFEKEYPPPNWAIAANGREVAKAIHYGQREMKDKWAGFQKGWQAREHVIQAGVASKPVTSK